MDSPNEQNSFLRRHVELLLSSYQRLTGKALITDLAPDKSAKAIWEAPFFVASHNTAADPVLTYGNQTALDLFEMDWAQFTSTSSRFTAEAPERAERDRLLTTVARQGYIDDYSGVRISSSGRRFRIERATVWNLIDEAGIKIGQAATFSKWEYFDGESQRC